MAIQKVIIFKLKDEFYGVPVDQVESIERWEHITRVPNAPTFIKGVMNLRGEILPVIDLQVRFELGQAEKTEESRFVIVQNGELKVALIVDQANDVIDLDDDHIDPAPETAVASHSTYIYGVSKQSDHLLILLNLEKVLRADHIEALNAIEV